ncbi:hypothetical protein AAX06_06095 [Moraxella bovoculi]|uniref:Uncharacterized protein n=1 Tax=Moraxella bovoculi TaxID=386891 RepID=A0AAC8PY06_9GAMM|nr:hypothetical protein AAX06_06095 [Moraxella bovoculi]AKG11521.1 hypothetical protein AAX07_05425 [Moraxella bovoculi]AKG13488.1 hypothetical protein AAX11_04955 [Moraxella bovoculi]
MSHSKQYILYTIKPLEAIENPILFLKYDIRSLKSEIPNMYKYRFKVTSIAVNDIGKPDSISTDEPYLIVCSTSLYGHFTTSMIIKGNRKYIYSAAYPITTKQPYRQLKEHYTQYLADKLRESL